MFQAEMGPVLEPHWGRERLSDGGEMEALPANRRLLSNWLDSVSASEETNGTGCRWPIFALCEGYLRFLSIDELETELDRKGENFSGYALVPFSKS